MVRIKEIIKIYYKQNPGVAEHHMMPIVSGWDRTTQLRLSKEDKQNKNYQSFVKKRNALGQWKEKGELF